jgi:hypothetical protein
MNLFIGEIFNEPDKFKQASIKANKIALFFKSTNNKYTNILLGNFVLYKKDSYGKYIQIAIGDDTRWNSQYECFRTLVKSKGTLRVCSKCNNMENEYNFLI